MDKKIVLVAIIVAALLMFVGTNMFYNTGLGITDLAVHKSDSNSSQYDVSYMLRSVRSFHKVVGEYTLLSGDNQIIGKSSNELNDIKDGTFQINETINISGSSSDAKKIIITLYEIDDKNTQKQMFNQTFDI